MLNRDFTKSNKDYFNKNKVWLIILSLFLIAGIVVLSVCGMKGNFEFTGYYEFSVRIGSEANQSKCVENASNIAQMNGMNVDTVSILDKGDNTRLVIRYINAITDEQKDAASSALIEKLEITIEDISEHTFVSPVVKPADYIYTVAAILILVVVATIFAYFRYNGASAISIVLSCLIGTLAFMSIGAMLRLSVGLSYFALLVILNVFLIFNNVTIFEEIRSTSWLANNDYGEAIKTGMKASRFRLCALSIALMILGILFVVIATPTIKFVSLNLLFMAVVILAVALYIVPFVWSVFITHCKKKAVAKPTSNKE